jgi:hypothetical protein
MGEITVILKTFRQFVENSTPFFITFNSFLTQIAPKITILKLKSGTFFMP